jgi:type IV fimbrial biogenesis protein FimT
MRQRTDGFTLWELLCVVGLAGVLLGTGVPALRSFLLDAKLTADVNGWILAVQLARSEAAKRGRPVIVCPTADNAHCGGATRRWMVFVNLDDRSPVQRSAAEPLLFVHTAVTDGSILSNRSHYEFRPGRRSTNGTVVLCDSRGAPSAKAVIVSYTGRPRVSSRDADGRPLRCAQLT